MLCLYVSALALTVAIELPVVLLVLRGRKWRRTLLAVLLANGLSHPLLHFALPHALAPEPKGRFILVGELAVFVLEALLYWLLVRPRPRARAITASAVANAVSYAVGLLIW